jgi:hypothetical protein
MAASSMIDPYKNTWPPIEQSPGWNNPGIDPTTGQPYRQPMQTPSNRPSFYQPQAGQPSYINPSLYTGANNSLGQYAVNNQYKSNVYKPFSNTASMLSNYFGTGNPNSSTNSNPQGSTNQGLGMLGIGNSGYGQDRSRGREGSVEQDKTDFRNENLSPIGMKGLAGLVASMFGGPASFLMGNLKYALNANKRDRNLGSALASSETSGHRGAGGAYSDAGYGGGGGDPIGGNNFGGGDWGGGLAFGGESRGREGYEGGSGANEGNQRENRASGV